MNQLSDVTFVIPIRVDSPERTRNLDVLVDFIFRHFDSIILILEADNRQRYFVKKEHRRIRYFFEEDPHPVFHRTLFLNHLYCKADTPIMAVWDTDVLVTPKQIVDTVKQIRSGNAVMGLPYDGHMYQTTVELAELYRETQNFDILIQHTDNLRIMYGDLSVGGAFIVDTEKYLQAGGENEFFLGWGSEDSERVKRIEILYSLPVYRTMGGLFHLWHPRYLNSWYIDRQSEINGKKEFLTVCGMCRNELRDYIKTWPWLEGLQHKKP